MKRELKVKELNLIDATKRRFLSHQQDQRRIQLQRLDDEIQRKVVLYLFPLYFFLLYKLIFFIGQLCGNLISDQSQHSIYILWNK